MESEQDMMSRISKLAGNLFLKPIARREQTHNLAGQINRHKNQQPASTSTSNFQAHPGAPYPTPNCTYSRARSSAFYAKSLTIAQIMPKQIKADRLRVVVTAEVEVTIVEASRIPSTGTELSF